MRQAGAQVPPRSRGWFGRVGMAVVVSVGVSGVLSGCRKAEKPAAALPPVEVTVSRPLVQQVTDALEFTGTTEAIESVEVRARVNGFLNEVHFQPRAIVNKGDVLFTVDRRPFEHALAAAKADLDAKKAQLVKADFDAKKITELYQRGQAAVDEFTKENANADALRAAVAAAEAQVATAQLQLDWCSVDAPIHGRVSRNLLDAGNIVSADVTVLATIVNDDTIYAYFNASERDVLTLREKTRKTAEATGEVVADISAVRPPAYLALLTDTGYPYEGEIDYAAPELDPGTGTVQLRARFPNEKALLIPGLFVRIRVPVSTPYEALTVTERALGSDQGQRYLFVVNDKNVVEYRPVKVGTLHEGRRVITAGLFAEDSVIVNGIQRVRPGVAVKPVPAPMPGEATEGAGKAPAPASGPAAH